ncbi:MAG TPA: hypothetical protein VND62_01655 [Acidimicrobiales bacterium]|nr:hypothetical protein [Acidimicrobiales bacterium]
MGLLDKVKTQAASATAIAKDAAQKGQAKIDAIQAKRAADALLRDLGVVVYGQRTGRATDGAEADVSRIVAALQAHEAEHGPLDLKEEAQDGGH